MNVKLLKEIDGGVRDGCNPPRYDARPKPPAKPTKKPKKENHYRIEFMVSKYER